MPQIGLEVDKVAVVRLPVVAGGIGVGFHLAERRLRRAFAADDDRRHQLAELALVVDVAEVDGVAAEATKIGEMYADLAKDAYKPYEAPVAKATAAVKAAAAA
ncbi:hypothetical protein D3C72_2017340 [compost metagenome]